MNSQKRIEQINARRKIALDKVNSDYNNRFNNNYRNNERYSWAVKTINEKFDKEVNYITNNLKKDEV